MNMKCNSKHETSNNKQWIQNVRLKCLFYDILNINESQLFRTCKHTVKPNTKVKH